MLNKIKTILENLNIPVAYNHFNTSTTPPFITFYRSDNDNFMADDSVYYKIENINIELYTNKKDVELETKLETLLDSNDISYNVLSETYIDSEKMYEVLYQINY